MKCVFPFCLAKTSKNGVINRNINWFVIPLRLLERDEWILLDKGHQPIGKNILELPRSVTKGLAAHLNTAGALLKINLYKQYEELFEMWFYTILCAYY